MKIRCSLSACVALLFAALLFAAPMAARADDLGGSGFGDVIELSQKDFLNDDGSYRVYELTAGKSYKLTEDVYGAVKVHNALEDRRTLTMLELGEHTLTTPASLGSPSILLTGDFVYLSVMNGSVIQESTEHPAVCNDCVFSFVNLDMGEEHSVVSNNHACIESDSSEKFTIKSGNFIVKNDTSNSPVIYCDTSNLMYVYGGSFVAEGGNQVVHVEQGEHSWSTAGRITILGPCTFSQYPDGAGVDSDSGLSLVCKKYQKGSDGTVEASFVAETTPTDYTVLNGIIKSQGLLGDVYFENEDDFDAFVEDHASISKDDVQPLNFTVTFDSLGGTQIESQRLHWGDKVVRPRNPEKKNFAFGYWWAAPGQSEFDFENTAVTSDLTLVANWVRKGRPTFGEEESDNSGEDATESENEKATSLISSKGSATAGALPQTGDAVAIAAFTAAAGAASAAVGVFRRRR